MEVLCYFEKRMLTLTLPFVVIQKIILVPVLKLKFEIIMNIVVGILQVLIGI